MKKNLIIVESPAKIKTISKFLGDDFIIMSTMGHVKDLPKKKLGVSLENGITIDYEPLPDKEKTIIDICKAAQKSNTIYLAPDPDREGEIIAWHIGKEIEKVKKGNDDIYRITFNEITKSAILDALKHPFSVDLKKVAAQQARRILDRLVGYEVSPVLWKKLAPGLSAGRVQSVALRLIVDREKAIQIFKPEEYWTVDGIFKHNKSKFSAALTHIGKKKAEIKNKKQADKLVEDIPKESYVIDSITDKERKKNPLPPFMTSTLQQAAYNRLGFTVKKTMQLAQQLYEGVPLEDPKSPVALITYMRTDSLRISDTALKQIRGYIKSNFSKEYLPPKAEVYEKKKSKSATQDAHEAIRPIDVTYTPEYAKKYLPRDVARLYELIWQRSVATQMSPAEYAQRQVVIKGGKYVFKITGSTLIFDGFLKIYRADEQEKEAKTILPADLKEKEPVKLDKLDPKQHFTQPPPRFTEASLVKEMEKEGIGRPSTYATILNTIRARDYTKLDPKKRFTPTELGVAVTNMLVENLPQIMDIKFTAHMEEDLDKVAQGELERDKLIKEFYKEFSKALKEFRGAEGQKREAIKTELKCPECKKEFLAIRFGKSGEFLGCMRYPDCTFTSNFERDEQGTIKLVQAEKPKMLEKTCPKCGEQLRRIQGKFGEFTACSGYPKCKYIEREIASFACPLDEGAMVKKIWRGGQFWGCENYPKCKFAIFDEVVEKPCPKCKLPFMVKKMVDGNEVIMCSSKECGYKK